MAKLSEDVCTSDCEGIARAVREKKKKTGICFIINAKRKNKGEQFMKRWSERLNSVERPKA